MQRYWWNHSRTTLILIALMVLAACGSEETLKVQSATYLPQDIEISFIKDETRISDSQNLTDEDQLIHTIASALKQSYFTIEDANISYLINGEESQGIITPENLVISHFATLHLTPLKNGSINVISYDHYLCQKMACEVKWTLVQTPVDNPLLLELQQKATEEDTLSKAATVLPEIDIPQLLEKSYWGINHEISDHLTLKLTPIQSNGLTYGVPEHTLMEPFQIGDMTINPENPEIEILSFYSNEAPSSDVHQIGTTTYLFIIPVKTEPKLDLSTIDSESQHYFADRYNLLAKDHTSFYAINYRYFPELKQMVIALTESYSLEEILQHFQAINSLKPTSKVVRSQSKNQNNDAKTREKSEENSEQEILLSDITLPLKELQSRYHITLREMFRVDEIKENYKDELKRLLSSEDLFLKTGVNTQNGYHLFMQYFGDYRFNETYLKIHNNSLKNVLAAVKALNNNADIADDKSATKTKEASGKAQEETKGLWIDPIYLYSTDPKEASGISYFKEIQPGVTLEIFSPAHQGHIAEKVLFSKMLSNFSWKGIPKLSKKAISNIAKYSAIVEKTVDNTNHTDANTQPQKVKEYRFKEGKTDLQGELLK